MDKIITMQAFVKLDLAEGKDFIVRYRERWRTSDKWEYGNILYEWEPDIWGHVWEWDLDEGQEIEIIAWCPVDSIVFCLRDDGTKSYEHIITVSF